MNSDVLLLAMAGILAVLSGGLVIVFAPGRLPSLLAGVAVALLGLLQIGFARVAIDVPWGGDALWFRYTLALALPVTAVWVLASVTLGSPRSSNVSRTWKAYLLLQALLSASAAAWLVLGPGSSAAPAPTAGGVRGIIVLDTALRAMLAAMVLNIVVYTVRFEATYLSLPRRYRRALRPALLAIVICGVFYAAVAANAILTGRAVVEDLAYGAAPVSLVALLVPLSYVRGRLGEARLVPTTHPVTATTSFFLAAAFAAGTAALLWMTQAWGVSFIRGLWLLAIAAVILGVTALVVSNRARRRAERALAPLWQDWGGAMRVMATRAAAELESSRSLQDLCDRLPENASALAEVAPVTLFLTPGNGDTFRSVSSTLASRPEVQVGLRDPLATELRRARRPIRLQGRADDLEYVSIYVENKEALAACSARYAIPLLGEEGLIGFLLCGPRVDERARTRGSMRLLHFASRKYASMIERAASAIPKGPQGSAP